MVSSQLHYIKRVLFMPFLLAEILNFQGSTHLIGVGSLSQIILSYFISYVGFILVLREFLKKLAKTRSIIICRFCECASVKTIKY